MGTGLFLDNNGHNIAFTAGTGVLVFLDVVAMILLQACNIKAKLNDEGKTQETDRKFTF